MSSRTISLLLYDKELVFEIFQCAFRRANQIEVWSKQTRTLYINIIGNYFTGSLQRKESELRREEPFSNFVDSNRRNENLMATLNGFIKQVSCEFLCLHQEDVNLETIWSKKKIWKARARRDRTFIINFGGGGDFYILNINCCFLSMNCFQSVLKTILVGANNNDVTWRTLVLEEIHNEPDTYEFKDIHLRFQDQTNHLIFLHRRIRT